MKKKILLVVICQLLIMLNSCSSDSGSDSDPTPEPPVVVIKTAKVTSYSKNYGETGETVSVYGENFSDKVSDIKITFDDVPATIVSATATEIKFTLPKTEKVIPKLEVIIENRTISNEVENNYDGNIGILPTRTLTEWITQENSLRSSGKNSNIQIVSDNVLYLAGIKTIDGGISWRRWASLGYNSEFHATINDEGWSSSLGLTRIAKIEAGGYLGEDTFGNIDNTTEVYYCIYVDANMKDGTAVTQSGKVYTTSNGVDFVKTYELSGYYC